MALSQNAVNIGLVADDGTGDTLRVGADKLNTDVAAIISAINNNIDLMGAGDESTVTLGAFSGATIPDGRTVKQALQDVENAIETLNVLDPGYAAGTATAPVAGDTLEGAIAKLHAILNALDSAVTLQGSWDVSTGTFPGGGTAQAGYSYIVSVAGTVDSVPFNVGDRIIALADNASTTTFAGQWFKADYTDQVTSVFGRTGAVVPTAGDYTATQITNTPSGGITATTVAGAITELDGEKTDKAILSSKGSMYAASAAGVPAELGVGLNGTVLFANSATATGLEYRAPTASEIANVAAGGIASLNVQDALNELDSEKVAKPTLSAKGSLISATAAATPVDVPVGTDYSALVADASTASGLAYSAQVVNSVPVANLATNTTLGAAPSVDVASHLVFTQTTPNITATIPNPTLAAKHRTVQLSNVGSTTLNVTFTSGPAGFVLAPENTVAITWTGAAWSVDENRLVTIAEHVSVYLSSDVVVGAQAPIPFDTLITGNIPFASSQFTLSAGKTYQLSSNTAIRNGASTLHVAWYNVTAGAYISPTGSTVAANNTVSIDGDNQATVIFTPSVTTVVELRNNFTQPRNIAGGGIGANTPAASQASIIQIGSSAFTGLNDQSASGYLDLGGMRLQWGRVPTGAGSVAVTFPAPFADTNYSVTANVLQGGTFHAHVVMFGGFLTTGVTMNRKLVNDTTYGDSPNEIMWQAIGRKP